MSETLAIMERAYRGAVEKQFFDALYLAVELHRQLGGMDLLLRGPAVGYAAADARVEPIKLGGRVLDTLTDPGRDLRRLQDEGVAVWVERPDIAAFGVGALLPGVGVAEPGEFARRWGDYARVCFL
ncbi:MULTISPECIES: hypothetical protein [Actinokineospora]|uniref:Uncharacterized protein n=1 Tax=Actinokineospora fastidiosa TaxID=1816 RepID=A0A918GHG8_9PSEU|nr:MULTISPECIES: hypothetical protein [Actinokineospora]UVS80641.1 hypothetical protein Actkin_04393 [Actinokineospora sp. UTMC 2448]GGS36209.1 hypothetical protein GCM10010171_33560 [Actinokineospora fastidiosa]